MIKAVLVRWKQMFIIFYIYLGEVVSRQKNHWKLKLMKSCVNKANKLSVDLIQSTFTFFLIIGEKNLNGSLVCFLAVMVFDWKYPRTRAYLLKCGHIWEHQQSGQKFQSYASWQAGILLIQQVRFQSRWPVCMPVVQSVHCEVSTPPCLLLLWITVLDHCHILILLFS